jgi:hypothetical protein
LNLKDTAGQARLQPSSLVIGPAVVNHPDPNEMIHTKRANETDTMHDHKVSVAGVSLVRSFGALARCCGPKQQ